VSNSLAESKNQIESERQSNVSEFNEVNKEINNLAVNIQDGLPTGTQSAVGSSVSHDTEFGSGQQLSYLWKK
jgi:hypothetical protein